MKKIYTFGDGFATGHIWPEWPQILSALCPDYQVVNNSGIGAGAEYLVHKLIQNLPDMHNCLVIFQWPKSNRFDKLIEDNHWQTVVDNDSVYSFNCYEYNNEKWWLSSNSKSDDVREYHNKFVQAKQHKIRSDNYQILVKHTLENINCEYLSVTTAEEWDFSFQPKYAHIRQNQVQPSPPVHFEWLIERILPNISITIDKSRTEKLKNLIFDQQWEPYHWDRNKIWSDLLKSLSQLDT